MQKHTKEDCSSHSRYLLNGALGLEEDSSPQKFSKDASHRPNVNWTSVVPGSHEDLRGPVILSDYLLSHVLGLVWLLYPGQTKVTNLKERQGNVSTAGAT